MKSITSIYTLKFLAIAGVGLILSACASTVPKPESDVTPSTEQVQAPAPAKEDIEYGAFTEDQLYYAIISELGAQRGQLVQASENYFKLAFDSRDLGVIRRAIQFASAQRDNAALLELGLLWADVSPLRPEPHLLLSIQFLEAGRLNQALTHMEYVIDKGGNFDFTNLSVRAAQADSRLRARLIENLQRLANDHPERESIRLALVQLLARDQQYQPALDQLAVYEDLIGQTASTAILEAQLLQGLSNAEAALNVLRKAVRAYKDDTALRLSFARLLVQNELFDEASNQFQIMIEQNPQDYDSTFSMAMLNLELENYDTAVIALERLVAVDQRFDESQFYLGYIYEQQSLSDKAIEHYRQVRTGTNNFLAAQQQATRLAIEQGQLEEAHNWLSKLSRGQPRMDVLFTTVESNALILNSYQAEAEDLLNRSLNKYPNDVDLLFARVLLWDKQQNRNNSEQDLRQIIAVKPDDSRALNHLGYMLADQTERYEEALELLEQAIALSPDDPAIIDSLAWAQYKLGKYDEAEQNLRRAFAVFPDHEVASHLGEVLWAMGRKDEAEQIWQDALSARPDSELLKNAIDRLKSSGG